MLLLLLCYYYGAISHVTLMVGRSKCLRLTRPTRRLCDCCLPQIHEHFDWKLVKNWCLLYSGFKFSSRYTSTFISWRCVFLLTGISISGWNIDWRWMARQPGICGNHVSKTAGWDARWVARRGIIMFIVYVFVIALYTRSSGNIWSYFFGSFQVFHLSIRSPVLIT